MVRVCRLTLLAGTALCAPGALSAQAPAPNTLPQGGAVIAGQASIATTAPNRMQVTQSSDRAVIGWQSFSVGANAGVDIRQPGAGSISVQQVQGNDPSRIFGQLSSNGRVVVANPNGVWFGPDARVDAAGIAAVAGRMSQTAIERFMADGTVRLDEGAAAGAEVVNEGRITAGRGGLAALVGPSARNAGTIEASGGRVQIAGAAGATVDFDGDGLIALRAAPGALAENTGRILAEGGRVRLTVAEARGVLAGAVNLGGVVEARSVSTDGGGITLGSVHAEAPSVTVTGRVDVSGPRGGTVSLLGDEVSVRQGARIDASGAQGGGTVRAGGDVRGAPGTRTARTTTVERGATVAADATANGHGGTVVVWADGVATMDGAITARGAGAGAGGFAEVSGLGGIAYGGTVDLRAPSGLWGTLLFDPTVINIVASGGTNVIPSPWTPGVVTLNASAVVAQLSLSNVDLVASSAINVNAPLAWGTPGRLTLTANTVTVTSAITLNGTGNLVIGASGSATVSGTLTINSTGSVVINAVNDVTLEGTVASAPAAAGSLTVTADSDFNGVGEAFLRGNIQLRSGALAVSGASVTVGRTTASDLSVSTTTGAITLEATNGRLAIGTTAASNSNTLVESSEGGAITLRASGNVLVGRATETPVTGAGTWSQVRSPAGAVSIEAGGSVLVRAGAGLITPDSFGRVLAGTSLSVTAGSDVVIGGGTGFGTAAASADSAIETRAGPLVVNATRNVIVRSGGAFAQASLRSGGDQTITAGGAIEVTGGGSAASIAAAGTQTLTATGAITLSGGSAAGSVASIDNSGGAQTISGRSVSLTGNGGEARLRNAGGDQAVTATAGAVTVAALGSGPAGIENSGGDQDVSGTEITLSAAGSGAVSISNRGGAQNVVATAGAIGLTGGNNAAVRIANDGGVQSVFAATTLTLTGGAGIGTAEIANGAGRQTVDARVGITLNGREAAARITAGDGDQTVRSDGSIRLLGSSSGTVSGPPNVNVEILNGLGLQTVTAGGDLLVRGGGANAGAAIQSGRDQIITAGGQIEISAGDATARLAARGAQTVTATDIVTLSGSTSPGLLAEITNSGGDQSVSGRVVELLAKAGGAAITNRFGNQAVTAAQLLEIRGGAGIGLIANEGGGQAVRGEAGVLLRAAANGGPVAIDNILGNQTVSASRGLIALVADAEAPVFIGNLRGDQTVTAATSIELSAAGGTRGQAEIFNNTGAQRIEAGSDLSITGGARSPGGLGGAAYVIALSGPQTITAGGWLTLTGAPDATPLGLSATSPTATPTPGSASIQSDPRTLPGEANGTADQRVSALGVIFAGPAGTSAIGLQDLRAENDSPAARRYQSVLSGGTELSVAGSTTVFALTPPPGPPAPPPPPPTSRGPSVLDPAVDALRQLLSQGFPRPVADQLGGGTGGFVPAGLAEEGEEETVAIAGEDPAAVFANALLAARIEGLLPPPVPYFPGFVSPPLAAATLR